MAGAPDITVLVSVRRRSRIVLADGTAPVGKRVLELFPRMVRSLAAAASAAGVSCELIVADAGSDDWPLDQWLTGAAAPLRAEIIAARTEPYNRGIGLNLAARRARAPVWAVIQPDMRVVPGVLIAGLAAARRAAIYAPYYWRYDDASETAWRWGNGTGNVVLSAGAWVAVGGWPEMPFAASRGADDSAMLHRLRRSGFELVREKVAGFCHLWHPPRLGWE